jgi:hypothetical protein
VKGTVRHRGAVRNGGRRHAILAPARPVTQAFRVYSTCLFCSHDLGRNEVIEQFPVGRRLAFDAAKGRLWVVCTHCRRWNLTPLEERWEAIEDAERRFRDTRLRVSTGEIGLARLAEGLELVRIGEPRRPEIAAWRYGEQFSMRRRKQVAVVAAIAAGGGALMLGGLATGVGVVTMAQLGRTMWQWSIHGFPFQTIGRFRADDGSLVRVRRLDLGKTMLGVGSDGGLAFLLAHANGKAEVEGEQALQVARRLFPRVNRHGGTPEEVAAAVGRLDRAGDAGEFLRYAARHATRITAPAARGTVRSLESEHEVMTGSGLLALSPSLGLAIEMALNEDQERRALEGELAELETAWREAEEIGAIADSMFLPESVERAWSRIKGGA